MDNNLLRIDGESKTLKRINKCLIFLVVILSLTTISLGISLIIVLISNGKSSEVYKTNRFDEIPAESIIPVTKETAVEGKIANNSAAYYHGSANYKNSTYYPILNFYDGEVSKTLKILPKFKTYQQTSATSCGDAAALMALRYFGIENVNEYDLYKEAKTSPETGTNTIPLGEAIKKLVGDKVDIEYKQNNDEVPFEKFLELINQCTDPANKSIMLLESVEWGGHWMTLIGYDDMGTTDTADDVLVFADPFDTTDHNQDGYYITSFQRYYSSWFDAHYLDKSNNHNQYVIVKKLS